VHPWRQRLRLLLVVYLLNCLLMAFLLPNTQWRYTNHLMPLSILCTAAALDASYRGLVRVARQASVSPAYRRYARGVAVGLILVGVLVGGGWLIELRELPRWRVEGHGLTVRQFPNLAGAAEYVRDHMHDGDVLLANNVYQIKHLMGLPPHQDRPNDYMPATGPFLPGIIDDRRSLLLDRRDGVKLLPTPESMVELFARHDRIWYVVQPGQHYILNTPDISTYLRQHMDVVYEDWEALVLFRDKNHRSASLRLKNEEDLRHSRANFLP
jgi:hypothetical protein